MCIRDSLKAALMVAYGRTQLEKDLSLLSMKMSGLKPSEVIARTEALNSDPATFLRAFIVSQFPAEVRTAIANMEFATLTDMGVAADKALEASKSQPSVNAVGAADQQDWDEDQFEVNAVGQRGGGFRSRGGGYGGQGRGGQKPSGKNKTCFFHDKHGLCLLYTSPSPRDKRQSRMPSSA